MGAPPYFFRKINSKTLRCREKQLLLQISIINRIFKPDIMRSLTTIFAAIAIALSTCVAVNAAPQGNTSADRQLRQLEARYDTLSNLRYTNAYIEAEKRVIEAKIEKIKHEEISSKPSYRSSSSTSKQGNQLGSSLEIIGPKNIQDNPKERPFWQVECDEIFKVNDDGTRIFSIYMGAESDTNPIFCMHIGNTTNSKLHQLNISVWDEDKIYPSKLSFDNEVIPIEVTVYNTLKEGFKDSDWSNMQLGFIVKQSEAPMVYRALTTKRFLSMTIGDVYIPLDQFTDSKIIFRALLDRLGTKVSKARNL